MPLERAVAAVGGRVVFSGDAGLPAVAPPVVDVAGFAVVADALEAVDAAAAAADLAASAEDADELAPVVDPAGLGVRSLAVRSMVA